MDISKKFVEMCEQAQEVQDYYRNICNSKDGLCRGEADTGDFYSTTYGGTDIVSSYRGDGGTFIHQEHGFVWLPRQDQIQELFGVTKKISNTKLIDNFYTHCIQSRGFKKPTRATQFDTLEQLWLSFYMEVKHNKVWKGKSWETITNKH